MKEWKRTAPPIFLLHHKDYFFLFYIQRNRQLLCSLNKQPEPFSGSRIHKYCPHPTPIAKKTETDTEKLTVPAVCWKLPYGNCLRIKPRFSSLKALVFRTLSWILPQWVSLFRENKDSLPLIWFFCFKTTTKKLSIRTRYIGQILKIHLLI